MSSGIDGSRAVLHAEALLHAAWGQAEITLLMRSCRDAAVPAATTGGRSAVARHLGSWRRGR
jgi:hypothetical protein